MRWAIFIIPVFSFSGCFVDLLMTSAITSDMAANNTVETMETMGEAQKDLDIALLRNAIQAYQAENGAYPRDLQQLVPNHLAAVPLLPDGRPYGYNPVTGQVFENADGPAPADYLLMESINAAIYNYGTRTGFYPASLDELYPSFLPTPPRTASGLQFLYDNQTGRVTHPDAGREQAHIAADDERARTPVSAVNAVGALDPGDLKNSDSLNRALDRIGY